jgi:hypothetical protein
MFKHYLSQKFKLIKNYLINNLTKIKSTIS